MLINILFGLMCLCLLVQPNASRFFAAGVFVGLTLLHDIMLGDSSGLMYYGSAALLDLGIIVLTSGVDPVPKMVIRLHQVCIASILVNFVGWILWITYQPPLIYNFAFVALYLWALVILLKRDSADVGGYSVDSWNSCIRFNWCARLSNTIKHGGTS